MARAILRVLCLSLAVLLGASVALAKPKPKAKPKANAAAAKSAAEPAPAPKPKAAQDTMRRTFSFSRSDEPLNPQPSLLGFPGLWKAMGANALPARSFGGTAFYDRINRDPGHLTISTTGFSAFVSLHRRVALAGQMNINRRILMRRSDEMGFGVETLAGLGFGGCPEPNCRPISLSEIVRFPGQRIPRTFLDVHNPPPRVLAPYTGFYNMYPWANRRMQTGLGELNLAGHFNLVETGPGPGIALALRPHISIPTRYPNAGDLGPVFGNGRMLSNGVQTGSWHYGLDLLIEGHAGDAAGIYLNAGFTYVRDPKEGDVRLIGVKNYIPVRIGLNVPRTSRLQFLIEYNGDHFVGGGARNRADDFIADATAGFRAYFTHWLALSGGYRHTLNQWGGDKHGFVAQLSASYIPIKEVPPAPVPPTVTCTADRTTVRPGESVRLTATASTTTGGTLSYTWSTTGGRIEGTGPSVRLDTTGLQAGTYSVTVRVDDGKGGFADCTVQVTVQLPPPPPPPKAPVVTCSADRTTVNAGEVVTLTARASSPDNRRLSYDWSVTGGRIEGTGATVRWDTTGLSAGTYTATARISDDRGLSADCSVTVTVRVVEVPRASRLNECNFKANSARVDNVCKAVLDDVALRLQNEAASRAVVIGQKAARERAANLAAQRASNVKHYLVRDKGIGADRIEVRSAEGDARKVEIWLVPRGAAMTDVPGTAAQESPMPQVRKRVKRSPPPPPPPAEKAPAAKK